MRTIQISTEVFAKIWSHRTEGEEDEDAILRRLLGLTNQHASLVLQNKVTTGDEKIRWRDDVKAALASLGGEAKLHQIYAEVRRIRLANGRTLPTNTNAIIRRELEYNSSDSNAFTGRLDWFQSIGGIGSGRWALKRDAPE